MFPVLSSTELQMQLPCFSLPKGEDSLVVRMSRLGAEGRKQNKGFGGDALILV